jgi:DNA replication and repair protein RecF
MILTHLQIRQFRNIAQAAFPLHAGLNLFEGQNAQGKTNVIEAALFLATSLSHRTRREEELIRWGEETAYLKGSVEDAVSEITLECGISKQRKSVKIDGVQLPKIGDLYGKLRVVLMAPEDLEIITGSPQVRRRFLDMAISQIDPNYIRCLQSYKKALKQRNHLLKRLQMSRSSNPKAELAAWDQHYIHYAAQVVVRRINALGELHPIAEEIYGGLALDGPFDIHYSLDIEATEETAKAYLTQKLEKSLPHDLERGSTHHGPHRDDMVCLLDGRNLNVFGSQGQRRTASLALRMAEAHWCKKVTNACPLLLIDDVIYEMDNTRRERFWDLMDTTAQVIITTTDRMQLGIRLQPSVIYQVNYGEICSFGP